MRRNLLLASSFVLSATFALAPAGESQIVSEIEIGDGLGGFGASLPPVAEFGRALASLGDLDGDGIGDLAVGAPGDGAGSIWILFLNADGTVKSETRISEGGVGGFMEVLPVGARFGRALAKIDDFDGDGVVDLAASASDVGRVFILLLQPDGSVASHLEVPAAAVVPTLPLGEGLVAPGDIDGDGVQDLLVGSQAFHSESLFVVCLLQANGAIASSYNLSPSIGISDYGKSDWFSMGGAPLGDQDGDGSPDVALGEGGLVAHVDHWGQVNLQGLTSTGVGDRGIACPTWPDCLSTANTFGVSLAALGDRNGDGSVDLLIGEQVLFTPPKVYVAYTDPGFLEQRSMHVLLSRLLGGFGKAVAGLPDFDVSGRTLAAIGAPDEGSGRVVVVELDAPSSWSQRNGTSLNPLTFTAGTDPVLGSSFVLEVDLSGTPGALATTATLSNGQLSNIFLNGLFVGELLIQPPFLFPVAGVGTMAIDLPLDASLVGANLSVQASVYTPGRFTLQNAIDLVLGMP